MARPAPDYAAVLDHVRRLQDASEPPVEDVERVLTDGYACVMRVEGERGRLRERLEQRAGSLGEAPAADDLAEINSLAQGIASADREVQELREALDGLAARIRGLRVA